MRKRAIETTAIESHEKRSSEPVARRGTEGADVSGLRGLVTSPADKPIPAAHVCLWSPRSELELSVPRSCVRTDWRGRFQLDTAPGTGLLSVSGSDGRFDTVRSASVPARQFAEVLVVLQDGGVHLDGRVIDASGGPVSSATVAAYGPGASEHANAPPVALAVSEADGAFSLSVAAGEVELRVAADGYATALVATAAPQASLEVALLSGSRVSGVVIDPSGAPVPGVIVQARSEQVLGGVTQTLTEVDGTFSLRGVSEGAASIRLVSDQWYAQPVRVEVERDSEKTGLRVVGAAGVTVKGTVLVDNVPCLQGQVLLLGTRAFGVETRAAGQIVLPGVPPGRYRLQVQCEAAVELADALELSASTPHQIWRLSPGSTVRVRLEAGLNAQSGGQLLVQALEVLSTADASAEKPRSAVECRAVAAKLFECSGLRVGAHHFSVSSGQRTLAEADAVLVAGENPELALRLPESGAARVRVMAGEPGRVSVLADGPTHARAELAPDGSFWLRHLQPGTYLVRTEDRGAEALVDVVVASVAEVVLTLPPPQELSGRVVGSDGEPVPEAKLVLYEKRGLLSPVPTRQRTADGYGRFSFGVLPIAEYTVKVDSSVGAGQFRVRTRTDAELRVPSPPVLPAWVAARE